MIPATPSQALPVSAAVAEQSLRWKRTMDIGLDHSPNCSIDFQRATGATYLEGEYMTELKAEEASNELTDEESAKLLKRREDNAGRSWHEVDGKLALLLTNQFGMLSSSKGAPLTSL